MNAAKLHIDATVEVREEEGCIVIAPVQTEDYDMNALIGAITPEKMHAEVSFGAPVGNEAL